MKRFAAAFLLLSLAAAGAAAQETRIAAVVNDDMISLGDVEARMRLIFLTSQLPDNPQVRARLGPQVLRSLIDEKLQTQEAKRFNLVASEDEVNKAFERLEQQNHLPPGGLDKILTAQGIPRSTLANQITAAMLWNKLIEGRVSPTVSVSDEEVNDTLARIKDSIGKPQSHVGEIFLAVDNPAQDEEVRRLGERLIEQIRAGANFQAVAQQFSQSPTAAVGGDLGWVKAGEMQGEVGKAIESMQPGQLSAPIRAAGGYYIIYVAERRTPGATGPLESVVTMTRVAFPIAPNADAKERQRYLAMAQKVTDTAKSCGEMAKLGEEMSPKYSGEIRSVKIGALPAELQTVAQQLPVAEPSKPISMKDGIGVVMVCERNEPPAAVPSRDQVVDTLMRQRLDALSRRYLNDLRRVAYVDMRS